MKLKNNPGLYKFHLTTISGIFYSYMFTPWYKVFLYEYRLIVDIFCCVVCSLFYPINYKARKIVLHTLFKI